MSYVIGVDFGTDSVRALVIDATNGKEMATAVHYYSRWKQGKYCNPTESQFRQHPLDYLEGLEISVKKALAQCTPDVKSQVKGISVDTTGSTVVAINKQGVPLSLTSGFEENPNAMFLLWKDHTAVKEAAEINKLAKTWGGTNFTKYVGGVYSSEWFWAKTLHMLRVDANVRQAAYSWIEHCDWIPAVLTGVEDASQIKRSRCAAGHKAMWHEEFDGLPSEEFLTRLDPLLKDLRSRLYKDTYTSDIAAGNLSLEWAEKLGLSQEVIVGVGAFDAHMGAVGAQIEPYALSKVMGTSTCDMLIAPLSEVDGKLVKGICGQVSGSIIPGMMGMEAGQSAFGDVYAWFQQLLVWPVQQMLSRTSLIDAPTKAKLEEEITANLIDVLSEQAQHIPVTESGILALDWLNGRRTPDANQVVKGAVAGLDLGSDAPRIFKALVEATAFGAKSIIDRFVAEGIPIRSVIGLGGVAKKSPFVMQTLADVLNMPIKIARSEQACALGAGMFATVSAGIYASVEEASAKMGSGFEQEYKPVPEHATFYGQIYQKYCKLGVFVEKEMSSSE
ncbi:ribulokinase [Rhodocytophaga rosea]|nr:ribulokinase [Rhodocytophaga rosea]